MNIFKIKKIDEELFYNTSSRTFDITGTLFSNKIKATRAFFLSKKQLTRTYSYYINSTQVEIRTRLWNTLTNLNSSTIVEYKLILVNEYDNNGKLILPIESEQEDKNILNPLDQIDFSTII